jgi:hypothetical protein
MAATFAPVSAMPVQSVPGNTAPVEAQAVVVINNGSVPVAPVITQPVVFVASTYPLSPAAPIPVVMTGGPVAAVNAIPVFQVGTVP